MKHFRSEKLIFFGLTIWISFSSIALLCLFFMIGQVEFIFYREEWLIPAIAFYCAGNFINFILYTIFRKKNNSKIKEIENRYISSIEKGSREIGFILWDPFSMKWFKYKYMKSTRSWYVKNRNWSQEDEKTWESMTAISAIFINISLLRPIYLLFIFSLSSYFKFRAMNAFCKTERID